MITRVPIGMVALTSRILVAVFVLCNATFSLAQLAPPVVISNARIFNPRTPGEVKTIEDAMAAIMTITTRDLGLPAVEPLYIHLHNDTNAFAANAGMYGNRLSSATVRFANAVAVENRIHVNLERTKGRSWGDLVKTLAHEYAHNIEFVFSSLYRGPQWIREGFAEWVAAKVLHHLGWEDYATTLHRAKLEVGRQRGSLPALTEIENSTRWAVWAGYPNGAIHTYRLGFLAVDRLMTKSGVAGMEQYFRSQDFPTCFGLSWNDFYKEMNASLVDAQAVSVATESAAKPEWKIGYQWQYGWKDSGRNGSLAKEVTREDVFEGLPVYVLKSGNNEELYSRDKYGLIATKSNGKILTKRNIPHDVFSWPLQAPMKWETSFVAESPQQKTQRKFAFLKNIPRAEDVTVPAGTFTTFKIETYGLENGSLLTEQWYAPKVRWFVKTRSYLAVSAREEELMSYKIN